MYVGVSGGEGLKSCLYLTDGKTEARGKRGRLRGMDHEERVLPADSPLYIHALN